MAQYYNLDRHFHSLLYLLPIGTSPAHGSENSTLVLQQGSRGIELHDPALSQDQYSVAVKHGIEPMRDCEHDRLPKLLADRALDLKERAVSLAHATTRTCDSRTSSSSSMSICEVASSMIMTLVCLRIALANAINCLSPALNEPPLSMGTSKMLEAAPCLLSKRAVR
jgi:hypothetical protein